MLTRREFMWSGSVVSLLAGRGFGATLPKPIARIGFMTDTHVERTRESCALVKKAFELFRGSRILVETMK